MKKRIPSTTARRLRPIQGLICEADTAIQNDCLFVTRQRLQKIGELTSGRDYLSKYHYLTHCALRKLFVDKQAAHDIVFMMFDLTQPEEDKIRPAKK